MMKSIYGLESKADFDITTIENRVITIYKGTKIEKYKSFTWLTNFVKNPEDTYLKIKSTSEIVEAIGIGRDDVYSLVGINKTKWIKIMATHKSIGSIYQDLEVVESYHEIMEIELSLETRR